MASVNRTDPQLISKWLAGKELEVDTCLDPDHCARVSLH